MNTKSSVEKIKESMEKFKLMPRKDRIDLMVKAGVMTLEQAEIAKKKLFES
jgi:hypothetical protein